MADNVLVDDAPHLYLTVADEDENQVLELIKSDITGMYVRSDDDWEEIDPDDDDPRVWDRIIIDVTPEAVPVFDDASQKGDVTADLFDDYVAPDEEQQ